MQKYRVQRNRTAQSSLNRNSENQIYFCDKIPTFLTEIGNLLQFVLHTSQKIKLLNYIMNVFHKTNPQS